MHITDYLAEEVLLQQPPGIQRFLLKISINREICESLGKALLGDQDPDCDVRQCLDYLEANELFLTGLDNRHEWYSLHQVFRDVLQRKLQQEMSEEVVCDLHGRAARWYAEYGQLDQALQHARKARNTALAIQIMAQGLRDVLNRTDRPMLERWLEILPNEVALQQPELLIMKGWDHALRWELDQTLRVAEQAEVLLDGTRDMAGTDREAIMRGQIAVMKGQAAYFSNQTDRAVALCRETLALMPKDWHYVRGTAVIFHGLSLYSGGHAAEAEQFLTAQYEAVADKAGDFALRIMLALALNSLQSGLFETTRRTAQVMSSQSNYYNLGLHKGWSSYLLGYIHYQLNELEEAERHFSAAVDLRYTTQLLIARNGMVGLAAVYKAQGKDAAAMATIDDLGRFELELYGRELISTAAARARLLLRQGDLDGAERWSKQVELPPRDRPLLPWMDEPLLTRVLMLIARQTPADNEAALNALDALDEIALRTNSTRSRVEILALRALAQLGHGDIVAARKSLIQSVELARHTGQIRVYVDLGLPMQKLLGQIAGQETVAKTAGRILKAFEVSGESGATTARPINKDENGVTAVGYAVPEKLTARELEVLMLMAEPMSFAEISQQLHIALSTTKRHSINLYEKLGVHSRWEAVAAAVELGILPPR
jgi:LuxR family transcriptional regulator, maltose regulon positive regulatory protein